MGLFDFVKEAGAKMFGADDKEAKAAAEAAQATEAAEAAAAKKTLDRRLAMKLVSAVETMGLGVKGLSIRVDGDLAVVSGTATSQSEREKVVLMVGNTQGIARVDDQMELAPEPQANFYTVKSGDSLSKIAKEQYGDAMKYPVIFEANKPMLKDPDKIYPGQVLRIPPLAG